MTATEASLGLDIGSTTIKLVLLDGPDRPPLLQSYRRHHADIAGELVDLIDDAARQYPDLRVRGAVTGSAGLTLATALGLPFVQEVIAETAAVHRYLPSADVIIELGGEDAKITYLHPTPEQRMNGTCAGGTGAFIDQMAALLHTDARGLDDLAARHTTLYPIASRCGVFAKSDLQPLINEGAAPPDLAASVFAAVVGQTISGLACGRPIRGHVVFLGGPLYFLPQLRAAFERALDGKADTFTTPERAQLYVALGAALLAPREAARAGSAATTLPELLERVRTRRIEEEGSRLPALFDTAEDYEAFRDRHAAATLPTADLATATGPCYLGIDAGSTTIKATLIDDAERIVYTHYAGNEGDPVGRAVDIVAELRRRLPESAYVARTCVTGYGEGLIRAAVHAEDGEVETMAHFRGAQALCPDVTSIIDIGGQDMKYLRVRAGAIDSICVNEACSSGCGSFLQTFATTMSTDVTTLAELAIAAERPVDLGSRCTVFMNSSVKQAQKEGADVAEIAAGLCYSVVRNALYKVIKLRGPDQLGERIVVQGGTFLNDAVLRAFEQLTGAEVVRPGQAGLMGAYGAARIARDRARAHAPTGRPAVPLGLPDVPHSRLLSLAEVSSFSVTTDKATCPMCQNHCQRTISTFADGGQHVTGNRCDRGADPTPGARAGRRPKSVHPNLFDQKYRRLFGYRRLTDAAATRGEIGIPRVLNMYEDYPFWFTALSALGFKVVLSGRSSRELFESGMDSIPSETLCYPAKLVHGHIEALVAKGLRTIFYPCIVMEQDLVPGSDQNFNCPVVMSYPEVIRTNVDSLRTAGVRLIQPFLNLGNRDKLIERLVVEFADWDVAWDEVAAAVDAGFLEQEAYRVEVAEMGQAALRYMDETGTPGIVLAGRPYHLDPELHHGIPALVNGLGLVVLSEDSIVEPGLLERPLRVRDQWAYHARLYEAAAYVVHRRPDLELVQLNSFGCGLDAITTDQVAEILEARGRLYTTLKIDEVSNLGAARIRLRSLQAAARERRTNGVEQRVEVGDATAGTHVPVRREFTAEMKRRHTLLLPQMAPVQFRLIEAALIRCGYDVRLLENVSRDAVEQGVQYVNNDACFPAIVVVGQLLDALRSREFDADECTLILPQTGGMCRATNYVALTRKAMRDAGFGHIPVLAVSAGGVEQHGGFSVTAALVHRLVRAIVIGDLLQKVVLRVRPYEAEEGATEESYRTWDAIAREFLTCDGWSQTLGRHVSYSWLIHRIVEAFDTLPLRDGPRRPRVGVVGEILVKYHPDANNHVVTVVERQGCEAEIPGLLGFVLNSLHTGDWRYEHLGVDKRARHVRRALAFLLERYQRPAVKALARSDRFEPPAPIAELAGRAEQIVSLGNQAGEGWYLTAEMMDMIERGVPNIVCAQPFACLPNHITGRGMFRELRRRYPQANLVAVDYDPGASPVNQLNRITLLISTAVARGEVPDLEQVYDGDASHASVSGGVVRDRART